ncbi:hypothetical protein MMC17_008331 [Xylographa soralifera]|nr:hypothetical protein [Xylographa soralifera]
MFVKEPDEATRRTSAKEWREAKLAELNYVGITSALVTSAFASAIGWQTITILSYVMGIWFAGLVLVLTSIYIASSQSITLHRLTKSNAGIDRLCVFFGHNLNATPGNTGNSRLRKSQVLVWQMPVMLLNLSITVFLLGLICQVLNSYTKTRNTVEVNRIYFHIVE